ncbi:hypothetical protein Ddc_06535 [Ditylenchus destructor]|nr:hypothetical protein Ddc_06535 [Ditylenchus destructor]
MSQIFIKLSGSRFTYATFFIYLILQSAFRILETSDKQFPNSSTEDLLYKENDTNKFAYLIGGKTLEEVEQKGDFILKMMNWYVTDVKIRKHPRKTGHEKSSKQRRKYVVLHAMDEDAGYMTSWEPYYTVRNGKFEKTPITCLYEDSPQGNESDPEFALIKAIIMADTLLAIFCKEEDFLKKHTSKFLEGVKGEEREKIAKQLKGLQDRHYQNVFREVVIDRLAELHKMTGQDPNLQTKLSKLQYIRDVKKKTEDKVKGPLRSLIPR